MSMNRFKHQRHQRLKTMLLDKDAVRDARNETTTPPEPATNEAIITSWLARLKLLYGVPFHYLVPDNRMLPAESIRFFQVDTNWVYTLVDGAFSPGRETEVDQVNDSVTSETLHHKVHLAARSVRDTLMGKPNVAVKSDSLDEGMPVISGFLLRSSVVGAWPGMEIIGYTDADATVVAPTLRFEILADDLLLCLFEGNIQAVSLQEPAESVHFGISASQPPGSDTLVYEKQLCHVYENVGEPIPSADGGLLQITGDDWFNQDARVLDVANLAQSIGNVLKPFNPNQEPYSSAEFGIEMVNGVDQVTFNEK